MISFHRFVFNEETPPPQKAIADLSAPPGGGPPKGMGGPPKGMGGSPMMGGSPFGMGSGGPSGLGGPLAGGMGAGMPPSQAKVLEIKSSNVWDALKKLTQTGQKTDDQV